MMNVLMVVATVLMAIATVAMAAATFVLARYAKASHELAKTMEEAQKDFQVAQETLLQGIAIAMAISGPAFEGGIKSFKEHFSRRTELFQ